MKFYGNSIFVFLFFSVIFITTGCKKEENPVTPPSDHFDPEGWVIRDATNKTIMVVFQGVIQSTWSGSPMQDTLFAENGVLSDHHTIKFLDASKNVINPPSDDDHKMGIAITDTLVVSNFQEEAGEYEFHLRGKKVGTTTLELQILHEGHVDIRTPKIPIKVR